MADPIILPHAVAAQLAGWSQGGAGQPDRSALDVFRRFTPPHDASATLALIRVAFGTRHQDAALAALRGWLRDGAPETAALLLCALLLRRGDPEAGEVLQRCLANGSEPSSGWIDVGDAFSEKDKAAAALLCYAKAPPNVELALRAGLVARGLGRRSDALSWFEQAVRHDPSSERAWFLLGTAAQDSRTFDRAAEAYRTVLRINGGRVEAEVNLGMCLQALGHLDGAKESYTRAVRARPDTFGRVAQALPGSPVGELWLDLAALRRSLGG